MINFIYFLIFISAIFFFFIFLIDYKEMKKQYNQAVREFNMSFTMKFKRQIIRDALLRVNFVRACLSYKVISVLRLNWFFDVYVDTLHQMMINKLNKLDEDKYPY